MKHKINYERHTREKPTSGLWREIEHTGTAEVTCSCGFDSGEIPASDIRRVASEHVGFDVAAPPATAE
ncbi:hypothetical protein ACKI1J_38815 [Streptomyces scabiei]|uniref:hypothetical protein n=1 Tax=Streptomyces scabiei TaxID=1930 RepID=UPI0039EFC36C